MLLRKRTVSEDVDGSVRVDQRKILFEEGNGLLVESLRIVAGAVIGPGYGIKEDEVLLPQIERIVVRTEPAAELFYRIIVVPGFLDVAWLPGTLKVVIPHTFCLFR